MSEHLSDLLTNTIPQFAFAIVLFWLCQKNSDLQRRSYEGIIEKFERMVEKLLDRGEKFV